MYTYVHKNERNSVINTVDKLIKSVQEDLREYFTFDIKLIGSGEKRLLTKNGANGEFDIDYNLILQKDKKGLISNQKKIKTIFLNSFNKFGASFGFKPSNNSTSVLRTRKVKKDNLIFSLDIAIMFQGNNGNFYKLVYDKPSNRYFWNEVKKTKNYQSKFKSIKKQGKFVEFKKRYLKNKNKHLQKNNNVGSFSIFLETLNEF